MSILRTGPVRVRVPATSANLGPGFDSFGLALQVYDEVTAEVAGHRVEVEVTGEGADDVPRDATHLVVAAVLRGVEEWAGQAPDGLRISCRNTIPHSRGLGSSAAAIVAGLLLARGLLPDPGIVDEAAVLRLATAVEGHPDNVAACLLGGFTLAWTTPTGPRATRLSPASGVRPVACVPAFPMSTEQARGLLPEKVPHADAAFNTARGALLVAALTSRPELLLEATEDRLHQPYRAATMPATSKLMDRLRHAGVAAVVSGAGPTVLALTSGDEPAALVRDLAGPDWSVLTPGVDTDGARLEYRGTQTRLAH